MKRFFYILFSVLASFFVWSCVEEEAHAPSYKDAGTLEVSFVYNDAVAKSITLAPASQTITVSAILNYEDVKWNVVSDKPWCLVDDDVIHEGSGTFEVEVMVNEGYDDREPANVSLCAGEYKANLRVTQLGNVFKLDQIFGLGMKNAGSAEIRVKAAEGVDWTISRPDWLTVDKVPVETANGETEYKMTVQWEENPSVSRLGIVELCKTGDEVSSARYALWQFGDGEEYDFEADGNIRLIAKPSAETPLEIRTPSNHIEELKYPQDWVQMEKIENDDNTTSWMLYFGQNPSDCNSYRETLLSYTTLGDTEGQPLPVIYQDYYSVGGLMSAKGFAMFAERFNAGENVSDWVKDGVVNMISSIDMSELEGTWIPIGTEEKPFNLKFNGDNRTLTGLSASAPLFGVCDGAEIYNLVVDKTCTFTAPKYTSDLYMSSVAGKMYSSVMRNVSSAASIIVNSGPAGTENKMYAAGLATYVDSESEITESVYNGVLSVRTESGNAYSYACIGGAVAESYGLLSGIENSGTLSFDSQSDFGTLTMGGVVGHVFGGNVEKCVTTGGSVSYTGTAINNKVCRGSSVYLGGLIGVLDHDLEMDCTGVPLSCDLNSIDIRDNCDKVCVGGLIGCVNKRLLLQSPKWEGNMVYTITGGNSKCKTGIGGIIGYVESDDVNVKGADTQGSVQIKSAVPGQTTKFWYQGFMGIGGMVGFAEKGLGISESTNNVSIDYPRPEVSNNGSVAAGGIVGRINQGASVISKCNNNGDIINRHLNNNLWTSGNTVSRTGGIIGTYGYVADNDSFDESSKIIIDDCHASFELSCYRGLLGGIAGYLRNAEVKNCSYSGEVSNQTGPANCNVGGIVGVVENSTITDCRANATVEGAANFISGGIVANLSDESSISGCSWFGSIKTGTAGSVACIAGVTASDCSVSGCRLGGVIMETILDGSNYMGFIVGNDSTIASECSYWDGK